MLAGQESPRLFFRTIDERDTQDWIRFFESPETSLHWVEEKLPPEMACKKWYAKQRWRYENNKGGMNALIEKTTGSLVGHAGLLMQEVDSKPELEIAYSLLPQFWNKGYASEAAAACKQFACNHHLAPSVISIISKTNIPSQKVALKNGMEIDKEITYRGNAVFIFRAHL